jgi:hypothetical protein
MFIAEIVTGTSITDSPKRGTEPAWSLTPLASVLSLHVELERHAVVIDLRIVRVLDAQLDQHAHLETLPLQRLDTGDRDLERVAGRQRRARSHDDRCGHCKPRAHSLSFIIESSGSAIVPTARAGPATWLRP